MKENGLMKKGEAGYKVPILGNKCYRCGYEWRPRNVEEIPKVCPHCKNPYWDRPKVNKNGKITKNL